MKKILLLIILISSQMFGQWEGTKYESVFGNDNLPFVMNVTTASVTISMKGTGLIRVVWGDNSFTDYTLTSTAQNVAHTYSGSATYKVKIYNPAKITYWSCSDNANYSFHLREFRKTGLTTISITGSNTISGSVSDFKTGLTYIYIGGSNTITGSVSDFKTGLTAISITGSNTITGSVSDFKTGLTTISIAGSNTISGSVSDFKTGLTAISITGSNTITGYTYPYTWSNSMNFFSLAINNGTGLSAAEVDQLCIDLDNSAWAGSGKTLKLLGSKIAAPTATSAAARSSLSTKGVSITTN